MRRNARIVKISGRKMTAKEAAEVAGITQQLMQSRFQRLESSSVKGEDAKYLLRPPRKYTMARKYSAYGENLTVVEWAKRLGVSANTLRTRLKRGWSNRKTFQ